MFVSEEIAAYKAACEAPPGARCLFCGKDVTGSYLIKAVYVPDPLPWNTDHIKCVGYGWVCERYGDCVLFPDTIFEKVPRGYGIRRFIKNM